MPSASNLRKQLETALSARIPAALSPRLRIAPVRVPCGVPVIDELLDGGLAVGSLTEFVGVECSGRTTMAMAYASAITRAGNVCAWIDAADSLDPVGAAANGIDLERLLWVRCGRQPQPTVQPAEGPPGCARPVVPAGQPRSTGGGSLHPRSEGRDMPEAIGAMQHLRSGPCDRQIRRNEGKTGTPGASNRPLSHRSLDREEQANSDRLPARRGRNLVIAPRCAEPQSRRMPRSTGDEAMVVIPSQVNSSASIVGKPWQAIDHAIRATDLLLQGGGFSLIVLDLGSTPPEAAWRIPMATWFRFRAACERARSSLLLLTKHPCARSSAEFVVRLGVGSLATEGNVMTGVSHYASTERSRSHMAHVVSIRKPPESERPGQWTSRAMWAKTQ